MPALAELWPELEKRGVRAVSQHVSVARVHLEMHDGSTVALSVENDGLLVELDRVLIERAIADALRGY